MSNEHPDTGCLWGKQNGLDQPYPLLAHLLDTSAATLALWDTWLRPGLRNLIEADLGGSARELVALCAGLHDIGKAGPVFQGQVAADDPNHRWAALREQLTNAGYDFNVTAAQAEQDYLRRHEQVGATWLNTTPIDTSDLANDKWVQAATLGHHGRFRLDPALLRPTGRATWAATQSDVWERARTDLTEQVHAALGLTPDVPLPRVTNTTLILISGLVVLADRIASEYRGARSAVQQGVTDLHAGRKLGRGWVRRRHNWFKARIRRTLGIYQGWDNPLTDLLGHREPRPGQAAALHTGRGLWLLAEETGGGKTIAALLRHAAATERLLFCLPTIATTNAMLARLAEHFDGTGNLASLAHHQANLNEFYDNNDSNPGLAPAWFLRNGAERMLAPVSVATIDQVVRAGLRSKFSHLTLLAVANAHIVIDEIHTADEYQVTLLEPVLAWCGAVDARVTLLSATEPQWQWERLARAYRPDHRVQTPMPNGPFHETVAPGRTEPRTLLTSQGRQVHVQWVTCDDPTSAHVQWVRALRAANPKARLGVVVNQVARAQQVAAELRAAGENVLLLHSRMTVTHRNQITHDLTARLGPTGTLDSVTVVGTQVLEASLDIDLDAISSDLAPAASLVQRVGRVWRFDDRTRPRRAPGVTAPTVHLVRCPSDPLPYFSGQLRRTLHHLPSGTSPAGSTTIHLPQFAQGWVDAADRADNLDRDEHQARVRSRQRATGLAHDTRALTAADVRFGDLARLTDPHEDHTGDMDAPPEEMVARTRDIHGPSVRVVVLDRTGTVPGGWSRGLQALQQVGNSDRDDARAALLGSVPLSYAMARTALRHGVEINDDGPLRGVYAIEVPGVFVYTPDGLQVA